MPCSLEPLAAAYNSYNEYISSLCEDYELFNELLQFLSGQDTKIAQSPSQESKAPPGSVSIIDVVQDTLNVQTFHVPALQPCNDRSGILRALDDRKPEIKARIVFIDYHRSWTSGIFAGLDRQVLDRIALQYRLHPEILRQHFGSKHKLDQYFENNWTYAQDYHFSPCATSQYFQLSYLHGFLSAHFHGDCACSNAKTVVVLARNEEVQPENVPALCFVDDTFPTKRSIRPQKMWTGTNEFYLQRLRHLSRADIASATENLVDFLIPYGNIVAVTESHSMAIWKEKVDEYYKRGTSDFDRVPARISEQNHTLSQMRANLREFQRHLPQSPSQRYARLIQILENVVSQGNDQVQDLVYEMNYLTAIASLKESKLAVEVSEQGITQNGRVKTLTQLAFVFIPLSAVASLFGMNLEVLNSGAAEIWMFVVGVIIAYALVLSSWGMLHPTVRRPFVRWANTGRAIWHRFRKQSQAPKSSADSA